MIDKLLKNTVPIDNSKIYFTFSGRVAINILAKIFRKHGNVLIPSYICNVVDKAFEKEKYTFFRYDLNEKFEPKIEEILEMLEKNNIDVLLFASLYGSGEFYSEICNCESKLYKKIEEKKIQVIIDFAQDFTQIYNLDVSRYNYHYIFSFNDKSFLGSMGAIIVTNKNISKNIGTKKLSVNQSISLIKSYLIKLIDCKLPFLLQIYKKVRKKVRKQNIEKGYEFSYCNNFPYKYDNYRVSNIQLVFGYIGILKLKIFQKRKKIFLSNNSSCLINTNFIDTSAYVLLNKKNTTKNKIKIPYAYYDNKYKSKNPDLIIIHNKGFCDK